MTDHPPPSPSTAKSLYGRAINCAYPECKEPLYREDEASELWTLNSRICHINARSENGPRWNAAQSAKDNRAEANLLLMCTKHASAIDDPNTVEFYTEQKLREWKREQIAAHKAAAIGWPLTGKMAETALSKSFPDFQLSLNNSTINLGGEGGRAPGSGGGGGGAIGPGSKGGNGGNGGRILNDSDDPDLIERMLELMTPSSEAAPGAGGAGQGAFGPDAIGGDGSDGGDIVAGILELDVGDTLNITVGDGGKASKFQRQDAGDGGDSVVTIKDKNGRIKRVIRAAGGKGAKARQLPPDRQSIKEQDIENGFQISTLLAVNSIEIRDSLAYILGGGWSKFCVPSVPSQAFFPCFCIATWEQLDGNITRGLQISLINPSGNEVSCIPLDLPAHAAVHKNYKWVANLPALLDQEGAWRICVSSGEHCLFEIAIVVEVQSGEAK